MRLLEYENNGEFSLTTDFGDETPQYAMLSHTWEVEEVAFKDLVDGTGKGKAGYHKVRFCGTGKTRQLAILLGGYLLYLPILASFPKPSSLPISLRTATRRLAPLTGRGPADPRLASLPSGSWG